MRQANPKSCESLSIKARGVSEQKMIADLKALHLQDGIELSDLFYEALELLFKKHHWPPGNPQLTLDVSLLPKQQFTPHCKCGWVAVKHGVHLASGVERDYCDKCFCEVLGRHDPKVWQWRTP